MSCIFQIPKLKLAEKVITIPVLPICNDIICFYIYKE